MEQYVADALDFLQHQGLSLALRLLAAIAIWVVGRWAIGVIVDFVGKTLEKREVDVTVIDYGLTVLKTMLLGLLAIGLLGFFGIDTAGFAALLAGAGVAIGVAWSGLLQDFAAGIFLLVIRPFGVGDEVELKGDVHGIIKHIGLFTTTIEEWVTHNDIIINNGEAFGTKIENLSRNPVRGAEIVVQLSNEVDIHEMLERFRTGLREIPGMVENPAPHVSVCNVTVAGPVVHVRPVAEQEHFWAAYWQTHQMIRDQLDASGYPPPANGVAIISQTHSAA